MQQRLIQGDCSLEQRTLRHWSNAAEHWRARVRRARPCARATSMPPWRPSVRVAVVSKPAKRGMLFPVGLGSSIIQPLCESFHETETVLSSGVQCMTESKATNITWHEGHVTREERAARL